MFLFDLISNVGDILGLLTNPAQGVEQLRPGGEGSITITSSASS